MKKIHWYNIVWGVLVIIIIALLTVFGFVYKNKMGVYKELEKKIVEAEKKYVDAKFLYPKNGEVISTSADELMKENYLSDIEIKDDKCNGYVEVSNDGAIFDYKAFIKCSKYTTKDYKE